MRRPVFKTEAHEAEWWEKNQRLIADCFEEAKSAGKLGKGTVTRVAHERACASSKITTRLAEDEELL